MMGFSMKIAIYKTVDGNDTDLLFDIFTFRAEKISELIAQVRKWLDELGPY